MLLAFGARGINAEARGIARGMGRGIWGGGNRGIFGGLFGREGQGSCRNTTGTIFDLHGPPGGSFMHICNDPQIGTVENAASVPICSSQPT